ESRHDQHRTVSPRRGRAAVTALRPRTAPAADTAWALLLDSRIVAIRQLHPADLEAVAGVFRGMSAGTMHLRVFHLPHGRGPGAAGRICRPEGPGHGALGAWLGSRLVGVAQFEGGQAEAARPAVAGGEPASAEVAFAVADDLHHLGVGTLLLEHLAALA